MNKIFIKCIMFYKLHNYKHFQVYLYWCCWPVAADNVAPCCVVKPCQCLAYMMLMAGCWYYCCCMLLRMIYTECPENCLACSDSGTSTRCIYDRCRSSYVYKVADGTCNCQFLNNFLLVLCWLLLVVVRFRFVICKLFFQNRRPEFLHQIAKNCTKLQK